MGRLRYPVENLLELLSSGLTIGEVLAAYPGLEREDLLAPLEFGALAAGGGRVVPPDAVVGALGDADVVEPGAFGDGRAHAARAELISGHGSGHRLPSPGAAVAR